MRQKERQKANGLGSVNKTGTKPEDKSTAAYKLTKHVEEERKTAARLRAEKLKNCRPIPHNPRLDEVPEKSSPGYKLYELGQASFRGVDPKAINTPSTPQLPPLPKAP
jgi:hypothetical protein